MDPDTLRFLSRVGYHGNEIARERLCMHMERANGRCVYVKWLQYVYAWKVTTPSWHSCDLIYHFTPPKDYCFGTQNADF